MALDLCKDEKRGVHIRAYHQMVASVSCTHLKYTSKYPHPMRLIKACINIQPADRVDIDMLRNDAFYVYTLALADEIELPVVVVEDDIDVGDRSSWVPYTSKWGQ
eukprot:148965_1